jgi:hypothetical protein
MSSSVRSGSPHPFAESTAARRPIRARRAAVALAATTLGTLALAPPASAATTVTFNYTGSAQTWTVPLWVTEATFDLYGAQGAETGGCCVPGLGGRATATIAVTPRDSIQVNVGGRGQLVANSPNGGFNGGGSGSVSGGGGASDIRTGGLGLTDRVLIAGGGGGDGGCASANGGGGGGLVGEDAATVPCLGSIGGVAGGGGTQSMGGNATSPATPGMFGTGGNAPGLGTLSGGGGGGWYGGGAGVGGGGGGGGSGYGPDGTAFQTGVRSGDGLVTVTYAEPSVATLIRSVKDLDLGRSITTSLLTPLNFAQKDVAAGNTAGACTQVAAFINQVQIYNGGGQIDSDDADALIFEANALRDSLNCGPAVAACSGNDATIVGTGGSDRLRGTNGDDVIAARGGGDTVVGLRGDDVVCGGGGADKLHGKGGEDTLRGGTGDDLHRGGGGDDALTGGAGDDVHHGGAGEDDCRGGGGSDSKRQC